MRYSTKYFVFNKESDYNRGSHYNLKILSPGISIDNIEAGTGIYFSRLLDTREKGTEWHRMLIEGETISEASVEFRIYACEDRKIHWLGQELDIGDVLEDETIDYREKQELLSPYCVKVVGDSKDVLLHEMTGRYGWIQIQLMAQGSLSPSITKIKMIFPKNTWMKYLPDIYREEEKSASFVERYLGMYQSLYQDMTMEIKKVSMYLNPDAVRGPFVDWLADWLAIEDSFIWEEEKLKYLVKHGVELYRKRGTRTYLQEMISLYTGRECYIVEYQDIEPFMGNVKKTEYLGRLYANNSFSFTIIINTEKQISNKEYQILTRIVEHAVPAHMQSNIVVLEQYIFLDKHSYLGINSILGTCGTFVLDGQSSIQFSALTNGE